MRVLTQPLLFSLITAFQSGILGIARTLLQRADADGLPNRKGWKVRNALDCYYHKPKRRLLRLFDALVHYDDHDLYALRVMLRAATFTYTNRERRCRQLIYPVCNVAATFGRADILQYLHDQGEIEPSNALRLHRWVERAVPHGHIHVLSWIEKAYGPIHSVVRRCSRQVVLAKWSPSLEGNAKEVLQWFADRGVGEFNLQLVDKVIRLGDLELLRLCLTRYVQSRYGPNPGFVMRAVKSGHLAMVRLFLEEYHMRFVMTTVELALHLRHDDIALLLLEHRGAIENAERPMLKTSIIRGIVRANEMNRLEKLVAVPDCATLGISMDALLIREHLNKIPTPARVFQNPRETFRLLLPVSTLPSVVLNLIVLALNKHPAADILLESASASSFAIPHTLVAFVKRARHDQLGPLTSQIINQVALDEMREILPMASPDDIRDAVLVMLRTNMLQWQLASVQAADLCKWIEPVLQFDRARADGRIDCDTEFLMACVSMSRSDDYRRCLEQNIEQLEARRVVAL